MLSRRQGHQAGPPVFFPASGHGHELPTFFPGHGDAAGPQRQLDQDAVTSLPHDLYESILVMLIALLSGPNTPVFPLGTQRLGHHIVPNIVAPLLVTLDLKPVARVLLRKLPYTWPPSKLASAGHLGLLHMARELNLLDRFFANEPTALVNTVVAATHAGYVSILEWIATQWPAVFASHAVAPIFQWVIVNAAKIVPHSDGLKLLLFWMQVRQVNQWCELAQGDVHKGIALAFALEHIRMIEYWAQYHPSIKSGNGTSGAWEWQWAKTTLLSGSLNMVQSLLEMEQQGKVTFKIRRGIHFSRVKVEPNVLDLATLGGRDDILCWFKATRPRSALLSSMARMAPDFLKHISVASVLRWWLFDSGVALRFDFGPIHQATLRGHTHLLDVWVQAHRAGRVSSLCYNSWTMFLASAPVRSVNETIGTWRLGHSWHNLDVMGQTPRLAVLTWWDNSGLDMKLPSSIMEQPTHMATVPGVDGVCPAPSVIDFVEDIAVLQWWLDRARRLSGRHPGTPVTQHFPRYTTLAMHRACVNNRVDLLIWWKNSGLPLLFSAHRGLELAVIGMSRARTQILASPLTVTAFDWWMTRSGFPIRFRGSLFAWAGCESLLVGWRQEAIHARIILRCKNAGLYPVGGGGMARPVGGYLPRELGEDWIFA